jgi:hypothetical protein
MPLSDIRNRSNDRVKVPPNQKEFDKLLGKTWGKALQSNSTLLHLDLSHNELSRDLCMHMEPYLSTNHSLYGLHLAGNGCTVDSLGRIRDID